MPCAQTVPTRSRVLVILVGRAVEWAVQTTTSVLRTRITAARMQRVPIRRAHSRALATLAGPGRV